MMGKIVHTHKSIYTKIPHKNVMPFYILVMLSFTVMWCKLLIINLQLYGSLVPDDSKITSFVSLL